MKIATTCITCGKTAYVCVKTSWSMIIYLCPQDFLARITAEPLTDVVFLNNPPLPLPLRKS